MKALSPRKTLKQAVNMLLCIHLFTTHMLTLNLCMQIVIDWTTQGLGVGYDLNMHSFSAPSKPQE